MFRDLALHVSNQLISQQNGYYGFVAAIYQNIWYSDDHRKSLGLMTGFYEETKTSQNSCTIPSGFQQRSEMTAEGKWYALRGPIWHGK